MFGRKESCVEGPSSSKEGELTVGEEVEEVR